MTSATWITFAMMFLIPLGINWLKSKSEQLSNNKWAVRGLVVLVAAIYAYSVDMNDQTVPTVESFLQYFGATVAGAQVSYEWLLKTLSDVKTKK